MPKKEVNLLKKQKRLIATRLMQISLLVDDYLYQQKPMAQRSAATYITEISGYKDKCHQDVRSLQVIEKLTRCLKGIIHEQQELNNEYFEDVFELTSQHIPETTNTILSPVYSTVDEDLTQYEEIDEDIRIRGEIQENENFNNEEMIYTKDITTEKDPIVDTKKAMVTDTTKSVKGNSNDITLNEKYPLNTELEVIEICDDEIKNQNHTLIEPDFNIQNAISHLSIKDIEEALTPFSQDCSQSILNSYYTTGQQNSVDPLTIDYEDAIPAAIHQKPATDIKCDKITKIVLPKKISVTERKIKTAGELIAIQNINKQTAEVPAKIDSVKALKPVPKKRTKNNVSTSKTVKARKAQIKPTKTVEKLAPKQKAKVAKQKLNVIQSYTKIKKASQNEQHTTIMQCNNKIPLTYPKQLDKEPTGNKIQNIAGLPIYNNEIVNDLSWIENIRFVREIQSEEYECFTEHELFWENYTLPNNWSENDFDY